MFHVVTMMPSKSQEQDEQQIHKKRQVGNDHVHVVWSEYGREYRPSTISSQFNDAHIVIMPMRSPNKQANAAVNGAAIPTSAAAGSLGTACLDALPVSLHHGLYRVSIFTKSSVPSFGPLQDNMVVSGRLLPSLVRLTALNANRAIRYATAGYGRPYPTRQKYIDEILAKHVHNNNNSTATTAGTHATPAAAASASQQPAISVALSSILMPLLVQGAQA